VEREKTFHCVQGERESYPLKIPGFADRLSGKSRVKLKTLGQLEIAI
jgi:hypothetical protein